MRKILNVLLLCTAVVLAACTRDVPEIDDRYNPASAVRFITTDAKGDNKDAATRGTPITDASQMATMGVFASYTGSTDWSSTATLGKMFDQKLNNIGGEWKYAVEDVLWGETSLADRFTFFAYSPYATDLYNGTTNTDGNGIVVNTAVTTGVPYLAYTVPTKVENQPDLMVAVPRYNIRPTGSPVPLAMNHALTSVGFNISGNGEKVVDIHITGVAMSGKLAMDGGDIEWEDLGAAGTTNFSASLKYDEGQTYYTTKQAMSRLIADDGYLMMIPQILGKGAKVVVTYSDSSTKEYSLDGKTWAAGQKVMYNITIKSGGPTPPDGGIKDTYGARIVSVDSNGKLNVDGEGYTVYFKWGSLIARSGKGGNGDEFDISDVVWVPEGFDYEALKAKIGTSKGGTAWANILSQSGTITEDVLKGWGDPCRQIEGGNWRMTTNQDVIDFVGFNVNYDISSGVEQASFGWRVLYEWLGNGTGRFNYGTPNKQVLPAAGATFNDGMIKEQNEACRYWKFDVEAGYLFFKAACANMYGHDNRDDGGNVRCIQGSISVSPSTYTFPAEGGTNDFSVTTTSSGTVTFTKSASWLTASLDGNILSVTADPNTGYSARSATIKLTLGSDTAVLTLSQGTINEGVLAPPGVIGYIKGTNELTLRGSKEYASNAAISNYALSFDPRGLSDRTVYVAMFKFGSLVAISGDPTDDQTPSLEPEDIITGPAEWSSGLAALQSSPSWANIPAYEASDWSAGYNNITNTNYYLQADDGKGDPCAYYAAYFGNGWRTPAYNDTSFTNFGAWTSIAGVNGRMSSSTTGMFYPAMGYRDTFGYVNSVGVEGRYWSATPQSNSKGYNLFFSSSSNASSSNTADFSAGYGVRCIGGVPPAVPTISISPATYTFTQPGGTKSDFVVTTQNILGVPTFTAPPDWLEVELIGNTITATAQPNPGATRTAIITFTVDSENYGTNSATLTITQKPVVDGILAPPGVIGYIDGTDKLTLKGSQEYANVKTPDKDGDGIGDIEEYADKYFGGLSEHTVYAAMFQFGSLVALSSDTGDTAVPYLSSVDIITGPDEWDGLTTLKSSPSWASIPVFTSEDYAIEDKRNVSNSAYHNAENIARGKGDPCMYYFGSQYGGGWNLPIGLPYNDILPDMYATNNLQWRAAGALSTGLPAGRLSTRSGEEGMFYPAVGSRSSYDGSMSGQNSLGYYWSSETEGAGDDNGYSLSFDYSGLNVIKTLALTSGFPVRCVVFPTGVSVSPATDLFIAAGETKTFTVTTTNFSGTTPEIASITDASNGQPAGWITTSWGASTSTDTGIEHTLNVTATTNSSTTTPRTATITLRTTNGYGSNTATLVINQERTVIGILAPPGVIGYIKGTHTLTLKGSQEYGVNNDIRAYAEKHFGGLSNETVYAALFKSGSLVATSSDITNNLSFGSEDIIAGPPEWAGYTALRTSHSWPDIPYASDNSANPSSGIGDPCDYWFGDTETYIGVKSTGGGTGDGNGLVSKGNTWRLPTSNPYNGTPDYNESNLVWKNADELAPGLPAGRLSTRTLSTGASEAGLFYPAVGYRWNRYDGVLIAAQNGVGYYWSEGAGIMAFTYPNTEVGTWVSGKVKPIATGIENEGYAVRCIPAPPTITISTTSQRFPAVGTTATEYSVETTFFTGTPEYKVSYTVSPEAEWIHPDIETISVNQHKLIVTVDENVATNDIQRQGTITLSIENLGGTATTSITITQDPMDNGGILAPPGVIGYIKGTNTLTLRGSMEYLFSKLDSDGDKKNDFVEYAETIHPDGLETKTVYVALFKENSLVAVSGDPTDNVSPSLEPWDVIAVPPQTQSYGQQGSGLERIKQDVANQTNDTDRWNVIAPNYDNLVGNSGTEPISGRGDPCQYWFANSTANGYLSNNWKMPTDFSITDLVWKVAGNTGLGSGLPAGMLSNVESGVFYPAAGYRNGGTMDSYYSGSGLFDGANEKGGYWTYDSGYTSRRLYFENNSASVGEARSLTGYGIRCVRD